MRHQTIIAFATILVFMFSAAFALAATVSVTPSGNGVFYVQGSGMDGVSGIQLDITYDAASLATPTVTQGGLVAGAMLAANTSRPGIIKIAIISTQTFSGSGQIATISFASKTGSGGITSIATSMIDSKGSAISSSANSTAGTESTLTAGIPFSPASSTQQQSTATTATATTATSTVSTATATYPGTITLPADLQQRTDQKPVPTSTVPVYSGEPAPPRNAEQSQPPVTTSIKDSKAEATPQFIVYKGISERFKLYNGSKNLSAIVTLFDKKIVQTIEQEPSILLSNGQSKATLTVDIPSRISSSPNFAVNGGKLVSFKQDKQSVTRWIIEVLPEAGAVRVTVTIIAGTEEFEFPLTVAPPVNTMLTLDEKGWSRFMKEVGTAKTPLHDLNNDGVRDYLDEYIFVANYLSNKTAPAKAGAIKVPKKK